jgi:hypothetical protein
MTVGLAAAVAVVVAAAIIVVAWPFVSPEAEPPEPALSGEQRLRLELEERRDAAYAELRELAQDARTGKVTPEDEEAERARLRAEAGAALRALDTLDASARAAGETAPRED